MLTSLEPFSLGMDSQHCISVVPQTIPSQYNNFLFIKFIHKNICYEYTKLCVFTVLGPGQRKA